MYARILSPVDGSAASDCGMREAIALARAHGAALRFLHVIEPQPAAAALGGGLVDADAAGLARAHGAAVLKLAQDAARAQGVRAEAAVAEATGGRVADRVVQEAERWAADLVVIGTHGCRGASGLFLGSDAEAIARLSPAPVLLARPPAGLPSTDA